MYVIENYTTNTDVSTLLQILSNMEKWHMIWVNLTQPYIPNKF